MKKDDIKIIISDIDGTLIDNDHNLSNTFYTILEKLDNLGVKFVAASGRGVRSIENKLKVESDNLYIISDNGAIVKDNHIIYKDTLNNEDVIKIFNVIRDFKDVSLIVTTTSISYAELHHKHNEQFLKEFYVDYKVVDDILMYNRDIVKISIRSDFNNEFLFKDPRLDTLKGKYHVTKGGTVWIDIMKKDIHKGHGLSQLLNYLNISPKHSIGFGDQLNDYEMLQTVNKAFVVSNANPIIKEIADEIIGSNQDNSVLLKISELFDITI